MKFFYFFLYLWVIFALWDPDLATQIMRIRIRIHNPGSVTAYVGLTYIFFVH